MPGLQFCASVAVDLEPDADLDHLRRSPCHLKSSLDCDFIAIACASELDDCKLTKARASRKHSARKIRQPADDANGSQARPGTWKPQRGRQTRVHPASVAMAAHGRGQRLRRSGTHRRDRREKKQPCLGCDADFADLPGDSVGDPKTRAGRLAPSFPGDGPLLMRNKRFPPLLRCAGH
jgi:hypothetical protein